MKKNIIKNITILCFLLVIGCLLTSCFNTCKHEYVETSRIEATCKKEGTIIKTCSLCQKELKETITKKPHTYTEEIINATCTEKGYTLKTCSECGHLEKDNYTNALGHNFSSWETIIEPTELSDGLKRRSCISCNHQEEEVISSISYIDLDIIKEPFDESVQYKCNSYEELLLKFNCALLKNAETLTCEVNFEYGSLQDLLTRLCNDEQIPSAFHVKTRMGNNILECTFTYSAKPELSSTYIYYQQYNSLNYLPSTSNRPSDYDEFVINDSLYTYEVSTSDQLYYALERGVKPICVPGSNADIVYQEMKKVLRTIISDNMTDVEKVIAIHDYIIMNVTYDEEVLQLLYQGVGNANSYKSFYLEGVFLEKKAVCEGISKAFASMCNVEGIPCVVVEGYPKANPQGAGHAWNKVYVNGEWYIVDATSDGTIIDGNYEILSYKYCLVDESIIEKTYVAKGYEHIVCDKTLNIYEEKKFTYNGDTYDFNIESMEELVVLIKYFEEVATEKTTIEFKLTFDYGDSCKDEINKAYQDAGYTPNYIFINSEPIFMLIKGEDF